MGEEGEDPAGAEDGEAAEGPPSMQQYAGEGSTNSQCFYFVLGVNLTEILQGDGKSLLSNHPVIFNG